MVRKRISVKKRVNISLEELQEWIKLAERYLGYDSLYIWNVNINGIILQLRTNNSLLEDFFRETWFPASLDHNVRPHGIIYAVSDIPDSPPSIYYHSESKTAVIINPPKYEVVHSTALGILMDIAEEQKEIHFLNGALVDVNGEGIAILGGPHSGKSTHTYLLLELERARIHSQELIYVEHLGGEKGRISTSVSERKFYIKKEIAKINSRLKELLNKCRKEDSFFILDPRWIRGEEKYVDTTRIKLILLLIPDKKEKKISRRLSAKEALDLLQNSASAFLNSHLLIINEVRSALQYNFFKELLQFAACYKINTSYPLFEVQKKIREIILSKEYTVIEKEEEEKIEIVSPPVDLKRLNKAVTELYHQSNVSHLTPQQIRKSAEQYGQKTIFNNYNFVSTVKNRSAGLTVHVGSDKVALRKLNSQQIQILKNLPKTLEDVLQYMKKAPFVCTQRTMGDNNIFSPYCTLYVSTHRKEMIRLAHMVNQTLFDPKKERPGPKLNLICIPEWQEKDRQILVFPEIGITFVLGTDYYGEAKKGFLRMAMFHAKQKGMLGVHAGGKIIKVRDPKSGKIKRYSMLIFGLTATGKTTHTCHNHGLKGKGEGIEIVQDDFLALRSDGSALGTERGFYLKTEGVNPEIQPLIYNAVTKPNAIFENVMVDYKGHVFFDDETLTGNGRGIMQRDDFGKSKSESVNIPPLKELEGMIIVFITRRNTVVPIASKLTLKQAAAAFMLGESIETSGSDPKRAGESVREVGTNPFIVGDAGEEGNIFYEFIRQYPDKIQCYLLNTGGVGEIREETEDGTKVVKQKVLRVEIPEMAAIIRGIVQDTIKWEKEPYFGTLTPVFVKGMNINRFNPKLFYTQEQIENFVNNLKKERIEYLERFKNLNPEIVEAIK